MTESKAIELIKDIKTFDEVRFYATNMIALDMAIKALEENQRYKAIGSIEELEILKEKSIPKKPIYSDYDDNGDDEIIPYKATCPVCEPEFEFGYWNDEYNHHCVCGQVMNWQRE